MGMVPDKVGRGSRASNKPWATSLEPQALSRACRYPWQLCESQPPTRHHHTDQVNGDTYQPNTCQIHQWGRSEEREKAEQTHGSVHDANCTTSHGWNAQHMQFEKPCMSPWGACFPVLRWPALAWLYIMKLSLNITFSRIIFLSWQVKLILQGSIGCISGQDKAVVVTRDSPQNNVL